MTTETDQHDCAGDVRANTTHRHRAHYSDAGTTTRTTTTTTVASSETATTSQRTKRLRERLLPIKSASQMCSPSEQRSHLKSLQSTEAGVTVSKVDGSLVFSVGHYRVQHLLGSGGAGRVYAGLDTRTGQTVALKICSKQLTNKQLARLQTEYKVMSNLEHRHIIKLHGVFENDSRMCLVMDYAEGGDLFDYIKSSGCLPRDECRRLFRQLTSALSYMHSKGYMHRDIKPENCLLDKQKNILLADFGFSNVWSSYKAETEGLGSLNFASPEIITSTASYIGPEVDLWSLGAVLYTMITGRLPFYSKDPSSTLRKIRRGAWAMDESIRDDPEIEDLLRRLLEPNPLKRATIWDVINHPFYKSGSKILPSPISCMATQTSSEAFESYSGSSCSVSCHQSCSCSSSSSSERQKIAAPLTLIEE